MLAYDVVIIGAGIAGLHTAHKLLETGVQRILILEKSHRIGGRIETIRGHMGNIKYSYEAGAGRISSKHHHTLRLVKELGLNLHPITHAGYVYKGDAAARVKYDVLIHKVIEQASRLAKPVLQGMSFRTLCENIIGHDQYLFAKGVFGYNAEFEIVNAYDGLRMFKRDFAGNSKYFVVREGFDAVTSRLAAALRESGKVHIRTRCTVLSIDEHSEHPRVTYRTNSSGRIVRRHVTGEKVVCALPQAALLQLFRSPKEHALLNSVVPVSLNRIYGFLDPEWMSAGRPVTTTNGHIRQFIPVRSDIGLAMVSYSDTSDADYWHSLSPHERSYRLKQDLEKLLGPLPLQPKGPAKVTSHYWSAGVHMWLPRRDSAKVGREVMMIKGPRVPVYVVGEAYSSEQGWVEGALKSVHTLLGRLAEK